MVTRHGDLQPKKLGLGEGISVERWGSGGKTESAVVTAVGVGAAADQAGLGAPKRAHAAHFTAALRTVVNMFALYSARSSERKHMATFFAGQPEVGAGESPFGSVRIDEAPWIPRVGDKVRQLVEKGAGQFLRKGEQTRIEQDDRAIEPSEAGGRAQSCVPVQSDACGQLWKFEPCGPSARFLLQLPQHLRRMNCPGLEGAGGHQSVRSSSRPRRLWTIC